MPRPLNIICQWHFYISWVHWFTSLADFRPFRTLHPPHYDGVTSIAVAAKHGKFYSGSRAWSTTTPLRTFDVPQKLLFSGKFLHNWLLLLSLEKHQTQQTQHFYDFYHFVPFKTWHFLNWSDSDELCNTKEIDPSRNGTCTASPTRCTRSMSTVIGSRAFACLRAAISLRQRIKTDFQNHFPLPFSCFSMFFPFLETCFLHH